MIIPCHFGSSPHFLVCYGCATPRVLNLLALAHVADAIYDFGNSLTISSRRLLVALPLIFVSDARRELRHLRRELRHLRCLLVAFSSRTSASSARSSAPPLPFGSALSCHHHRELRHLLRGLLVALSAPSPCRPSASIAFFISGNPGLYMLEVSQLLVAPSSSFSSSPPPSRTSAPSLLNGGALHRCP